MKHYIYSLEHIYTDESHTDCKLLGFFNNLNKLEEIKNNASKFLGFKNYPDNFVIIKNELNKLHWSDGFFKIVGEIGRDYLVEEDVIYEDACVAQNLKSLFYVSHTYTVDTNMDDERILGVFTNSNLVKQIIEKMKEQPGFRDYPENFIIDEIELNQLLWTSGF